MYALCHYTTYTGNIDFPLPHSQRPKSEEKKQKPI